MKQPLFLLFILLAIVATGCKKKENSPTSVKENILADNAYIVDTTSVLSCSATELKLRKAGLNFTPKIGDIVLASPSGNNPTGVFSKITSISDHSDLLVCAVEPTNLNEAFKQLLVDYTYKNDYSRSALLKGIFGIPLPIDFELAGGFTVNGYLQLNIPDVQIKYHKLEGSIMPDTVCTG